ncbi:hypothetical protein BC332_24134 [Capsicum chinense]|nr:hypothetical protein BC332_24134 [Capsicum chinense]
MGDEIGEFDDLNQKIASLEREKHLLIRKVEELEASGNHQRVILELKEREMRGLKQKLEELDGIVIKYNEWKNEKDVIYILKDELAERVREMLTKVSELEKKLENLISEKLIIEKEKVGWYSGLNVKWPVVVTAVSIVSIGLLCYRRDGRNP